MRNTKFISKPNVQIAGVISVLVLAVVTGYIITTSRAATLVGDINGDNTVNVFDLSVLLSRWGQTGTNTADLNANGTVDVFDLSVLLSHWGQTATPTPSTSPTPTATPTPSSTPTSGLWLPKPDKPIAFHWVLGGALSLTDPVAMGTKDFSGGTLPEPDVYDIDGEMNTKATVDALHAKGKKVICYFDAGVYETYRTDAAKFQALSPQIWGSADEGWDGSYWLDIRRVNELAPIMQARMQMCKDKDFDGIEPDEITNWSNNPGFPITYNDQIVYNRAVASWAHALGMSIGLKGDLEQAHDLVNDFDWTLNEECFQYGECTTITNSGPGADGKDWPGLQLFVQANKAVWVAEYTNFSASAWNTVCSTSKTQHFNTTLFKLGLPNNGGRNPCPTTSATQW